MNWSPTTQPTVNNIRKRIAAASEALEAAQTLADRHPKLGKALRTPIHNAKAWAHDAMLRTMK